MKKSRILIVDDHEIVRLGLKALFSRHRNLEVVGEAINGAETVERSTSLNPDLVIMDLRLPQESGVAVIKRLRALFPRLRILGLTAYADVDLLADAMIAGANGCLLKEIDGDQLVQAIETVMRGETYLEHSVMETLAARIQRQGGPADEPLSQLTWQERRILTRIARKLSNRDIANELHLSEKTIRNYVSQILGKLALSSRTQAAAFALRHQLEGD